MVGDSAQHFFSGASAHILQFTALRTTEIWYFIRNFKIRNYIYTLKIYTICEYSQVSESQQLTYVN